WGGSNLLSPCFRAWGRRPALLSSSLRPTGCEHTPKRYVARRGRSLKCNQQCWAARRRPLSGGRMKALLSHQPGGPETLRLDDIPAPSPGPNELLVRVRACSINFPDVLIIEDK